MLCMYVPLEEALQNEAVGMNFSRQPVSIPSHIQGDVNVIHKLDCMPLAYWGFLWTIPAVKTNVEINQQHALRKLTLVTHMHLTTSTGSHLALWLGWKKTNKKKTALHLAQLAISLGLELVVLEWKLFHSRLRLVLYVFNVPYFHLCVISNSKTEPSLQCTHFDHNYAYSLTNLQYSAFSASKHPFGDQTTFTAENDALTSRE